MPTHRISLKPTKLALVLSMALFSVAAQADDNIMSPDKPDNASSAQARPPKDASNAARVAAAPKTPAIKTITNFSQALRCMDDLFIGFDKKGIVITSAGIPDETGKVKTGTKEMLITAISKMTIKSGAFEFIDFHRQGDDLGNLFAMKGGSPTRLPDYYIRGSITQMDDNAVRKNMGFGIALPFLDLGFSKDDSFDLLSMDMSVGDAASRRILPETSTSNTMIISKSGRSGEAGGKVAKAGLSFNLDLSRSEGMGATTRTLVELGLIEVLWKFTRVPYWKCLDIDSTNPTMMDQAREGFESLSEKDRVLFVQRKLGGSMNRYEGPIYGIITYQLKTAIAEYQKDVGLIADGRLNFDLYYSLFDDTQNQLAELPATPQRPTPLPAMAQPSAPQSQPTPKPVAATPASKPVAESPAASQQMATNFQVRLTSDRGTKPTYKIGEFLNVSLSLSSPGMAYCYYEDVAKNTARIFPNQFNASSMLNAGGVLPLLGGGFKIKFDQRGQERVACIGDDHEVVVPGAFRGTKDLTPMPVHSLDEVITQFKQVNPTATTGIVEITVQ